MGEGRGRGGGVEGPYVRCSIYVEKTRAHSLHEENADTVLRVLPTIAREASTILQSSQVFAER